MKTFTVTIGKEIREVRAGNWRIAVYRALRVSTLKSKLGEVMFQVYVKVKP